MFQWFPVYLQVLMIICVSIVLNTCMLLSPWLTTDFHILVIIFVCHVPIISLVTLTSWLCACFCISLIKRVPLVPVAVDVFPQSHLFLVYPSITSILLWFAFEFLQICQYLFSMNNDKSITKWLKKNCQYFIVKWWEFDGNSLHAIYSIPVFLLPPCCILYLRCRLFRSYVRLIILYQAWSAPFETFMFSGIEPLNRGKSGQPSFETVQQKWLTDPIICQLLFEKHDLIKEKQSRQILKHFNNLKAKSVDAKVNSLGATSK